MSVLREFGARFVEPLASAVASLVLRGVVRLVDDSLRVPLYQVTTRRGDPTSDDVRAPGALGLGVRPVAGAEAVVLRVGAAAEHEVAVLLWDIRARPTGRDEGEVDLWDLGPALGTPTTQQRIRLRPGVGIAIAAPYGVDVTGDLEVTGGVAATGQVEGGTVRSGDGLTGTYPMGDGHTITVAGGIVTGAT
jgi:phage gp45-like